jgi:hypothetical protein
MDVTGTQGNDVSHGTTRDDYLDFSQGGNDTVQGRAGNDNFYLGAAFNAHDSLNGGAGFDTLQLDGSYAGANALVMDGSTIKDFEKIVLDAGNSYTLTTNDGNVAPGTTLTVDASQLGASDTITFNGRYETDGHFSFVGGAGDNHLNGGNQSDIFDLTDASQYKVNGYFGNDTFDLGATLVSSDQVIGNRGTDVVMLDGDYTGAHALTFGSTTMLTVETLQLAGGHSYDLTTNDATVAAGATLEVDASALHAGDTLTFDGSAETNGRFIFVAGQGTYNLTGSVTPADIGGHDYFYFGANFNNADRVDAGSGTDHLVLEGNYSGATALTLSAGAMADIEVVALRGAHDYDITSATDQVYGLNTAPVTFTAFGLGTNNSFHLDDSLDTQVMDRVFCGEGTYDISVGSFAKNLIAFGGSFNSNDVVHGNTGMDTLGLNGDFTAASLDASYTGSNALTFGANQLSSIEILGVTGGYNYNITMNDGNVAAGETLTIEAAGYSVYAGGRDNEVVLPGLGATDKLTFNGAAENDGHFVIDSGAGADSLTGGALSDTFVYNDGIALSGATRDTIHQFDFSNDIIKFSAVTGIDTAVTTGSASTATIDTDLTNLFGAGNADQLSAHHAVLFTADSGNLAGDTFLIVDGDGVAGYTAGHDLVIQLASPLHIADIGTSNFIG